MRLVLERFKGTENSTVGKLLVDGKFQCYTLEDPVRDKKIASKTAIPAGVYKVDITMSNRFKKRMPLLLDVPGFTGIRIHTGNTAADTEGCLLVGKELGEDRVGQSRPAYNELFEKLEKALKDKESVMIEVRDSHSLFFDGKKLQWLRNQVMVTSWPAVSGRPGYQTKSSQHVENKGPIPEGTWRVRQDKYQIMPPRNWIQKVLAELGRTAWPGGESSWGKQRIWVEPTKSTQTYGRSGFSIHGGDTPGSAGCIDLTSKMPDFSEKFVKYGRDLLLNVQYGE